MNKHVSMALGLLCASTIVGCADDFDPPSLVNKLRVLAVQADHPFASPSDEVKLAALAHDIEGRALSWGWGTCEALDSTGALDCLRQLSFAQLQIGPGLTSHTLRVPDTRASYLGVVVVACPGTLQPGTTSTLPIACIDADGRALTLAEFELGLKRIFVRDRALNQNPRIDGVTLDGASWDAPPMDRCERTEDSACSKFVEHTIEVRAPGASESSVDLEGLPIREQAVVQFYATGGEFEDDARLADGAITKWRARREDAGQRVTFWFVVRDDRGGVSWTTRELLVP